MPGRPPPIEVRGSVRVETGGRAFTVDAAGDRVNLDLPDAATLKALLSGPGGRGQLRLLAERLDRHGLAVEVRLKGRTIVVLGRNAEPGTFEKMLGLGAVSLSKRQLVRSLFKPND